MRDIRQDLQERLEEIEVERAQIGRRIQVVQERAQMVAAMLKAEEQRWAERQAAFPSLTPNGKKAKRVTTPLGRVLVAALADQRQHSLDDLKEAAVNAGMDFGKKHPGRVIHFALIGMQQNKIVERTPSGEWQIWKNGGSQGRA